MTGDAKRSGGISYALIVIGLISCSMLMYEILLTRICALRLYFHFGFLVISNCLLGIGASGSLIAVLQNTFKKRQRLWIWRFSLLYVVSLILTYAFLLTFGTAPDIHLASLGDMVRFSAFNLVAAVPFFFAGFVIGLILTFNAEQVNKVYFLDLLGAGFGCLLSPLVLWVAGAGGCFVFLTLMAVAGAVAASPPAYRRLALLIGGFAPVLSVLLLPNLDRWFPVPSKYQLTLTQDVTYPIPENLPYSRWSAISRVDLIDVRPEERYLFGRGKNRMRDPLPEMKLIVQDGAAGTLIVNWDKNPPGLEVLKRTSYSLPTVLKKDPRVFVIGVGGGCDVWAAKVSGAKRIKGVELNQQILDIHRSVLSHFSKGIVEDPSIELVCAEGRTALMRDDTQYDIIQMSGIDTYTSLASGAYVLAENYLYTVEAMQAMYDRLADDGIIAISRLSKDMETLRVLVNIFAAVENRNEARFEDSVICLYTDGIVTTTLFKKGGFSANELTVVDQFTGQEGIRVIYHPKRTLGNIVEKLVRAKDKYQFIREFPRNISPTSDDRPYFFNYSKWTSPIKSAPSSHEPTSASQGNPLFILGQLAVSTFLALVLILLPVVVVKRTGMRRTYLKRFLLYFLCLGLGFIAIEIALMQKLVLFLGHPLYSITVTLFTMLVFTGIGSLVSERWFHSPTRRAWFVPVALAVLLALFTLLSPNMVSAWIAWPKLARILVTVAILAPIGLLLGVPFAYGIRLLNRFNPTIIPWAWAVNGCMTVIGSILAVIFSMNIGFNFVLIAAIPTYFLAFLAIRGLR